MGYAVFMHCINLVDVVIGSGLTAIANNMFQNCDSLENVTIGENVATIGDSAFQSCTSLERIYFPNSVTSIGNSAFNGCTALTEVTFGRGLLTINQMAFDGCTSLVNVTIPEGVTTIGRWAFRGNTSLVAILIPSTLTTMGNNVFVNCPILTICVLELREAPATWNNNWNPDNRPVEWNFTLFQPIRSVSTSMQWANVNDDDDEDDEDAKKEIGVVVEWEPPALVFNTVQINRYKVTRTINNLVEEILTNIPRIIDTGSRSTGGGGGSGGGGSFLPGDNIVYQVEVIYIYIDSEGNQGERGSEPSPPEEVIASEPEPDVSESDLVVHTGNSKLVGNFPNPFNPETTVRFTLPNEESVVLEIFNVRGQRVRTLVNGYMNSGMHNIVWNGKDDSGREVGSGVYFYRLIAGDYQSVRRMILMK